MSAGFLDLMCEIFPNISKETKGELHRFIRAKADLHSWLYSPRKLAPLCQGDIVKNLPIVIHGPRGGLYKRNLPAILLNNTCDMSMDKNGPRYSHITVAPLLPFDLYINSFKAIENHERDIKENVIKNKFYISLPPGEDTEYIVDLGIMFSVNSSYLYKEIENNKVQKVASLSQNGYYYFLAKMTLYLMRPETQEIKRSEETE